MPYYHATLTDHGPSFVFDEGGYHEKASIADPDADPPKPATVHHREGEATNSNFEQSDTPELSAAKSPEAAVFAQAHNLVNDIGAPPIGGTTTFYVYRFDGTPDLDLSACGADFPLLEEVRYRRPSDCPVEGTRSTAVEVPNRALTNIDAVYLPKSVPGEPYCLHDWGREVKRALRNLLDGGDYDPDPEHRPDINDYR